MSYIGNSPGVASQRVESAFTATASQTVFTPTSGYTLGYCDVYQNGVKLVNGDDYTAADGATVTLTTGAASGDSIVIVASFPRGLSDGYLKSEADAKYVAKTGSTMTGDLVLDNGNADGAQLILRSAGYSNWNIDNYSGKLRAYYNATEHFNIDANGTLNILNGRIVKLGSATSAYLSTGDVYGDSNTLSVIGGDSAASALAVRLYNGGYWYPLQVKNTGDLQVTNGNLVLASGKGIDFSASSNASGMTGEVLDDYEVGTFSPQFWSISNCSSITTLNASYVKTGRQVTVCARFALTVTSASTDTYFQFDLPFAANSAANSCGACTDNNAYRPGTVSTFGSLTTRAYVLYTSVAELASGTNSIYLTYSYISAN